MAAQSKKNSKSPSSRKKSTQKTATKKTVTKKTSTKKKPRKKKSKPSKLRKVFLIFFMLIFMGTLMAIAYYLGQETTKKPLAKTKITKPLSVTAKKRIKVTTTKKEPKKNKHTISSKVDNVMFVPYTKSKPKLVIIIDDVHTKAQISAIKSLPIKVTPSIFPPYKLSPNSHHLARGLKHYMIHLPMESGNKQYNTQYKTLKVSFSNKKIENRIKELRLLFPKAKFINNHTGSVFTSNYDVMHLAYKIMRENGFIFLDSKTKNTSKVKNIAHAYGDVYVVRDIFIDNIHTLPAIHEQLKKAVKIAKKKGYAIAIGHPHTVTMKALASAKYILKDVELAYIDALYQ